MNSEMLFCIPKELNHLKKKKKNKYKNVNTYGVFEIVCDYTTKITIQ